MLTLRMTLLIMFTGIASGMTGYAHASDTNLICLSLTSEWQSEGSRLSTNALASLLQKTPSVCPDLRGAIRREMNRRKSAVDATMVGPSTSTQLPGSAHRQLSISKSDLALLDDKTIADKADLAHRFAGFLHAAKLGDATSEYLVGVGFNLGIGVSQDKNAALVWFSAAANAGFPRAEVALGLLSETGDSIPRDYKAARNWYGRAADTGNAFAEYELGRLHYNGFGGPTDYAAAVELFQKAADQGLRNAQAALGICYARGLGVTQDYSKSMEWLRKAETTPNAQAERGIGDLYSEGWGVPRDNSEALTWYQKAADVGDATAEFEVGQLYEEGLGVAKDANQALIWYHKAAIQDDVDAQLRLGEIYHNNQEGIAVDTGESIAWYRRAEQQGAKKAVLALATACTYHPEQFPEGCLVWFQKVVDSGDPHGYYAMGWWYESGTGPNIVPKVQRDFDLALKWYQKAADAGDKDAMERLGCMYFEGFHAPKDQQLGVNLIKKAGGNLDLDDGWFGRDDCEYRMELSSYPWYNY